MKVSPKQYAQALLELAENAAKKEIPEIVDKFIKFLARERHTKFAKRILDALSQLILLREGRVKIFVDSAQTLNDLTRETILNFLGKKQTEVEFEEKVDPNLLGGVKIRLNDMLVDATLSGQLEKLRQRLQ